MVSDLVRADDLNNIFGSWDSFSLAGALGKSSSSLPAWRWLVAEQGVWREDNPRGLRVSENYVYGQFGYSINDNASIWIGYLHDWQQPLGKNSFEENRAYQDYLWVYPVLNGQINLRTRMDERVNQTTGNVGVRVRELIQFSCPLKQIAGLSAYMSGELFAYLNQNSFGVIGFSEARAATGLSYNVNPHLGMDFGYLAVFINNTGKPDLFSHNVQVNLRYTF